jgi:hypothetical protein
LQNHDRIVAADGDAVLARDFFGQLVSIGPQYELSQTMNNASSGN